MPVIVKELVLRIQAEQPDPPGLIERIGDALTGETRGPTDEELLREAVAETLRVLREKKER